MADGSNASLQPATPRLSVDGVDNPESLEEHLLVLVIVETSAGLYRCEATFGNWGNAQGRIGYLFFDRQTLDFGKSFVVRLRGESLFEGRITGLEARFPESSQPEVTVLAEDRLQDLRMTRRTRSFTEITDADMFRQIAADHGLTAEVNLSGPRHKLLAQVNQSDLAFLRDRCQAIEAELWIAGGALHAAPRARRQGQPLQLGRGGKLREFSVLADLANQRTDVVVGGWDVATKTALRHTADDSLIRGEEDGDSGASILSKAFGRRTEVLAHRVPLTAQDAQTEAEAWFRRQARRFVVGHGLAESDGKLRVGVTAELNGLGPLFSGRYYLSEVRHLFDRAHGLRTEFTGERPGLGRP